MYYWYIFGAISLAVPLIFILVMLVWGQKNPRIKRVMPFYRSLFVGVLSSATLWFFPIYYAIFSNTNGFFRFLKTLLMSFQNAARLFAFDDSYLDFLKYEIEPEQYLIPEAAQTWYALIGGMLYLLAPILTFGFILSFFRNAHFRLKYSLFFCRDAHIFSELNEKSFALAKSIVRTYKEAKKKDRSAKPMIVFTDVLEKESESYYELVEDAKELGAVLLRKDLESIKFVGAFSKKRRLRFYLIGEDEAEKVRHAAFVMEKYDFKSSEESERQQTRKTTRKRADPKKEEKRKAKERERKTDEKNRRKLYVFSDDIRCELLLASNALNLLQVVRVNDIQSLIYYDFDRYGLRFFQNARDMGNGERLISAVIVGLGKYGFEMLKALTWFCQMPGYRIKIHAFDVDKHAKQKFATKCPELMHRRLNGQMIEGEARYEIHIHSGVDILTSAFTEQFSAIKDATFVFVCLGDDEINLSTSVTIRELCERIRYFPQERKPDIETVIYDSNIKKAMSASWDDERDREEKNGITNFRNQEYGIHMIGDLDTFYSVESVINSELVEVGRNVHLGYAENSEEGLAEASKTFDRYEYNYRSSVSKALHLRMREKMKRVMKVDVPGVGKTREEILKDPALMQKVVEIEHVRWNAYMRSEGYVYSGDRSASTRNDLAKQHHFLRPTTDLTDEERRKDV